MILYCWIMLGFSVVLVAIALTEKEHERTRYLLWANYTLLVAIFLGIVKLLDLGAT